MTRISIAALLAVFALASGTALAAPKVSQEDRIESRIQRLHSELRITPDQEAQWSQVTEVMRQNEKSSGALAKARADNAAGMTALDDLKSYEEITRAHADGIKEFTSAFAPLYAGMSDAQKVAADELFRRGTSTKSKKR
jgi:Tfp pilus assembly protein FimT